MKPGQITQIKNAGGERLPLAEDIARHIATRPRVPKFVVTYWLRTLRDAELLRLGKGAWHLVGGAEPVSQLDLDELHAVMLLACQGEQRNPGFRFAETAYPMYATTMLGCIGAERGRRLGWIEVRRSTGITVNPDFDLQLTPKGMAQYREGQDRVLDSVMRFVTNDMV